jgi:dienelactone hydrolase
MRKLPSSKRGQQCLALALFLAFPGGGPRAELPVASLADGRTGNIPFASATPEGPEAYLAELQSSPAIVVSGELRMPAGTERVPAIVLTHSAGGISSDRDLVWAERFVAGGMASFVIDSFGPRGVKSFANQPSFTATLADAYAALRLLLTHPRIDPDRIVLMGFSRGGTVSLVAALEPMRRRALPDGARFAAHVALYPGCTTRYLAGETSGAPVLMLLGGADDQAPPGPCRRWAEWFRTKGTAVHLVEYPNARHLFDGSAPIQFIAEASSAGGCDLEYDVDARRLRRTDTETALVGSAIQAYMRGCVTRGVHVGSDPEARREAPREVAAFLKQALR